MKWCPHVSVASLEVTERTLPHYGIYGVYNVIYYYNVFFVSYYHITNLETDLHIEKEEFAL